MPSAFKPFLPVGRTSSGTTTATPLSVPTQGDSAAGSAAFAALVATPPPKPTPSPPCPTGGKPTITLHREGDRVTQIRVQCSCGEVVEIDCAY